MSTPDTTDAEVIVLRPTAPMASVQGSLALDLTPRTAPPRPRLRSARSTDLVAVEVVERGRVDAFVGRYLQALVEIAAGDRPVSQVLRHTVPSVRPDDVLGGIADAGGITLGAVPLLTRLAQGPLDAETGALGDPLRST